MIRPILILAALAAMLGVPSTARAQSADDEGALAEGEVAAEGDPGVSFDTFQAPLAAYGEWVEVGSWGRAWRPYRVAAGWRPYYLGHWAYSDDGWLWVSDEPFGWATYHYGRWAFEPGWGWIWVPGYEWAPAWVDWRYNEGCVGWFPMTPLGFIVQRAVYEHWVFVPSTHFVGFSVHTVAFTPGQVQANWDTTVISRGGVHRASAVPGAPSAGPHDSPIFGGPPRHFAEQRLGHAIEPVRPVAVGSPAELGRGSAAGELQIFRPPRAMARPSVAREPSSQIDRRPIEHVGPAPAVRPAEPAHEVAHENRAVAPSAAHVHQPVAAPSPQHPVSAPPPVVAPRPVAPPPPAPAHRNSDSSGAEKKKR